MANPSSVADRPSRQPRALYVLFFAEMWERFSFYGMRAFLILYMAAEIFNNFAQSEADSRSYGVYGAFNALLYAAPIVGGMLADRLLGARRAVVLGHQRDLPRRSVGPAGARAPGEGERPKCPDGRVGRRRG